MVLRLIVKPYFRQNHSNKISDFTKRLPFLSGQSIVFVCLFSFLIGCKKEETTTNTTSNTPQYAYQKTLIDTTYAHFCQLNATDCGNYQCGPAAFMMARKMFQTTATVNATELARIAKGANFKCNIGTEISGLADFAKLEFGNCQPNFEKITTNSIFFLTDSTVLPILKIIRKSFDAKRPLVVPARMKSQAFITDRQATDFYSHFVVIVGLQQVNLTSTIGDIYYVDPLDASAKIRRAEIWQLIEGMRFGDDKMTRYLLQVGCE